MKIVLTCVFLVLLTTFCTCLHGQDKQESTSDVKIVKQDMMEISPFYQVLTLYQKTLSKINGSNCSMLPSCSRYAQESFKKHGFLGLFHTSDRLIRCSNDTWQYHSIVTEEGLNKYADKVFP